MTPLALGVLAVLLAGPVPRLLARVTMLRETPRTTMVLWQSIAVAAVLAALGAGASLATDQAWRRDVGVLAYVVAALALIVTGLVLVRLLVSGHRTGTRLRALRRRHVELVDVVASRDAARSRGRSVLVLDHDLPVAYCVPGMQQARVVVSRGVLGRLAEAEIDAVLEHERAHLRARHDLVLEAFTVVHHAFPRWVSSASALDEVKLLVEVLADRAAVRCSGRRPLARALVELAGVRASGPGDGVTLGGGGRRADLMERVRLIADCRTHRLRAAGIGVASVSVLVLPTTFVVMPWLAGL
ncbi:M56 family metallopeptidase [Nocardioides sp.]|uniref:M56 family metallopeptidase n=1 Tax=Nocardioides sp. TaxID=35761 RepID=UPI001D6EA18A|nr:M56 family metallopeptidase [Nocardioides sp.]MBU1802607.1 M56 family metallopeptidase [Actinomycetota bacterium]